ncbi:MAG: hypothetical protein LRZ88_07260 [Candidatus Cloacimonetes bacterium]|nr:hypothetical protein [Candidatus Cloacimonadota bacterium]
MAYVRTSSSLQYSEPNSLQLTNSGDAAADLRWVSPSINQGINRIRLRFKARSSSNGQTLLIGTQSDPASAFNLLQSVELSTSWSLVDLNLAGYSGSDQHLVFKHGLGGTYRSIYLDDLEIVSLPAYDLSLQALSGPAYAADGNNLSYSVQVKNESYNPMQLYTVQLLNAQTSAVLLRASSTRYCKREIRLLIPLSATCPIPECIRSSLAYCMAATVFRTTTVPCLWQPISWLRMLRSTI